MCKEVSSELLKGTNQIGTLTGAVQKQNGTKKMKCIGALTNSKMNSWLFYGEWILCIPRGLQSALASTSQRTANRNEYLSLDILEQRACGVGGETLLSYDVNTHLWRSSYPLLLSLFTAYYLSWVCFTPWHHLGGCDIENRGCPRMSPIERIPLEQPLVGEELSSSYPPSITSSLFLRTPVLLSLVVPFHVPFHLPLT